MSAKDDYPKSAEYAREYAELFPGTDLDEITRMLTEIDKLRRWKQEAIEVLIHWDAVADRFDLSKHYGYFTADGVLKEVIRLQEKMK